MKKTSKFTLQSVRNHMKRFLLISCILFYCSGIAAQNIWQEKRSKKDTLTHDPRDISMVGEEDYYEDYIPVIVPEYFLLGTFDFSSRYMGQIGEHDIQFFQENQEYKVDYMKKYIQDNLGVEIQIERNDYGVFFLKSPELASRINDRYFDKNGRKLKRDIFHTQEQICSFLLGVYFQGGKKRGNSYSLRPTLNSELVMSLLMKINCRKILFIRSEFLLAGGYTCFDFSPSVIMRKYFEAYDKQHEEMYVSIYGFIPEPEETEVHESEEERERYEKEMIRQQKAIDEVFTIYNYFR